MGLRVKYQIRPKENQHYSLHSSHSYKSIIKYKQQRETNFSVEVYWHWQADSVVLLEAWHASGCTMFWLLSSRTLILSFQIRYSFNIDWCHVHPRNAIDVSLFRQLLPAFYFPLGTSCCPKLSCLISSEAKFSQASNTEKL